MKRKCTALLCSFMLLCGLLPASAFAEEGVSENEGLSDLVGEMYEPGEIIVGYEDSLQEPTSETVQILSTYGAYEAETIAEDVSGEGSVVKITAEEDGSVDALIEELSAAPGVRYVQRNFRYYAIDNPSAEPLAQVDDIVAEAVSDIDDPFASEQYYLDSWENAYGANVYEAWEYATTNHSVTIAVLDTGVLATHEDLADNLDTAHMKDVFNGSAPGVISDVVGHGTHVAGIASAMANNEIGIAGASYNAKVLPIKVFNNASGNNAYTDTEYLIKAYSYLKNLIDAGELSDLHVINMSLGGYGSPDKNDRALEEAISELRGDGYNVLTVCAGGNGDANSNPYTAPSYPADFDECLSVTALDESGANVFWSDYNEYKDISAPGVNIYSTFNSSNSSYISLDGTSMASPLVAGIAALLWAKAPELTVDEAVQAITESARPVNTSYNDRGAESGSAGAIDATAALEYIEDWFNDDDGRIRISEATATTVDYAIYDGTEQTPEVTVSYEGKTLTEGTDYEVSYSSNIEIGTASVIIAGLGDYKGSLRIPFSICYDLSSEGWMVALDDQSYTGKAIEPSPRVYYGTKRLVKGSDYTLSYLSNIMPGLATVVITGKGDYRNTIQEHFLIIGSEIAVTRLAGETSADTAADISAEAFPAGSEWVVIARDDDFADAMSATGLAGTLKAPIVLTNREGLSEVAADEIERLGASKCYVIGGTGAMPGNFEGELEALGLTQIQRIFGTNSWDTSVACAEKINEHNGNGMGNAIVAMSGNFQDALSISSYAYKYGIPLYLESNDASGRSLPSKAQEDILSLSGTIYVAGGYAAVPSTSVEGVFGEDRVVRLSGETGYDTSLAIASYMVENEFLSCAVVSVATGALPAKGTDALAGAALAGVKDGVVLLVNTEERLGAIDQTTLEGFLPDHAGKVVSAYVLGGTGVLSDSVIQTIKSLS